MAHKNVDYDPESLRYPEQKIVKSELVKEMETSYIEYAMSVIVGRALPDVRDGLKPVHRRILYTMREDEVAGWVRSLQLRQVELPDELKDEVFLIIGERRQ